MAIDFTPQKSLLNQQANAKDEQPKSEFWLNVGYSVDTKNEEGHDETVFISLPMGIALDSMKPVKTNSSNKRFTKIQQARNSLAEQIMEFCKTLQPGETGNLNLQIQVRRIAEEQSSTAGDDNEFACKLSLVG